MLKEVRFENWKSFERTTLHIDPLTVLIGSNASGKSNAVDALQLLHHLASGINITTALESIRGGLEWACLKDTDNNPSRFALEALVGIDDDPETEYWYRIELVLHNHSQALLFAESLHRLDNRPQTGKTPASICLFNTAECDAEDNAYITVDLCNVPNITARTSTRTSSILSQLATQKTYEDIDVAVHHVTAALKKIFILAPMPAQMRNYSPLSEQLKPDALNIAGVLAALDDQTQQRIESTLTDYFKHLPENNVLRVYAEPVGKLGSDAMLYCDEVWGKDNDIHTIDARGLSDGSLRFLAIITALLTRPPNSLLVIEDIDHGLHPSRSELLVKMLTEIGQQQRIDLLITTHNPALLNALGPEMVPFMTVAHREPNTGKSQFTLLEDVFQLPKLLAGGPVGKIVSESRIEAVLQVVQN